MASQRLFTRLFSSQKDRKSQCQQTFLCTDLQGKLRNLRSECDRLARETKEMQWQIRQKRKQLQYNQHSDRLFLSSHSRIESKIVWTKCSINEERNKLHEEQMQTQVLNHVITRMKQDAVHFQLLSNSMEEERDSLYLQHSAIKEWQEHGRCIQLQQKYTSLKNQRTNKLQMGVKHKKIIKKDNITMEDGDKQTHLFKSIQAHKLIKIVFQQQFSALTEKYVPLENAYHALFKNVNNIIIQGVTSPNTLVSRYLDAVDTTFKLKSAIGETECKLRPLLFKRDMLKSKLSEIQNIESKDNLIILEQKKETKKNNLILLPIIKQWIEKRLNQKLGEKDITKLTFVEQFKQVISKVMIMLHQETQMPAKYVAKGMKVKKYIREITNQDQLIISKEQEQMNFNHNTEEQYLHQVRSKVLKKNFMIKQKSKREIINKK